MRALRMAFLVALFGGIFGVANSKVEAATNYTPADYTYAYNATDFYSDEALIYEFSSLESTAAYSWFIDATDLNGNITTRLFTKTIVSATSGSWTVGGGGGNGVWDDTYTGPVVVTDNYGNTLGRHFVAASTYTPEYANPWATSTGTTPQGLKQAPGVPVSTGDCRAAPYRDINPDGYHHSYTPCSQQVGKAPNDFFLFHYRLDVADYGDGDQILFYELGTTTLAQAFNLDNLIENNFGGYSGGIDTINTRSFTVVNTGPTNLPFIDYEKSDADFPSPGLTPHRGSVLNNIFEYGAYNCVRQDGITTNFVSDCESPLLVSRTEPISTQSGSEWIVTTLTPEVEYGSSVTVRLREQTPEIWDSYSGAMAMFDSATGYVDTDLYSYSLNRDFSYTAPSSSYTAGTKTIFWQITPNALNSFAMTASEARFIPFDTYDLTDIQSAASAFNDFIASYKLDTNIGKMFIMVFTMIIGVGTTAAFAPKNFFIQLVVFSFIGAAFVTMRFATFDMKLLAIITSFVLWLIYFAFIRFTGEGRGEGEA